MTIKAWVIGVSLLSTASLLITPAAADPDDPQDPDAGKACLPADLNQTAASPSGAQIRCLANGEGGFSWMPDTGAVGTIAQLQKEGFTIILDRNGTKPLDECTVNNVWGARIDTETNRSSPGSQTHAQTITVSKTINVSLDCL
ncbi:MULTISPECIES: hypothetical protein [unclassified Mycolicibacterium]|uniref:hypothetical protein n=1 Tax=unclassified Mycolicibacterium TaxID=2636767 RepID=UPI002EDAF26D